MKKHEIILSALAVSLLFVGVVLAAPNTYSIDWWVIDSGGVGGTVGSVSLSSSLGQAVVGRDISGATELCSGFWCGVGKRGVYPEHWVYLPLALRNHPVLCSEAATAYCLEKGWFVVSDPSTDNGTIVCTVDGRLAEENCGGCGEYNIVVWEDGAGDRLCPLPIPYSTYAGNVYCGHNPCECGDNLIWCGVWDMQDCIPDLYMLCLYQRRE